MLNMSKHQLHPAASSSGGLTSPWKRMGGTSTAVSTTSGRKKRLQDRHVLEPRPQQRKGITERQRAAPIRSGAAARRFPATTARAPAPRRPWLSPASSTAQHPVPAHPFRRIRAVRRVPFQPVQVVNDQGPGQPERQQLARREARPPPQAPAKNRDSDRPVNVQRMHRTQGIAQPPGDRSGRSSLRNLAKPAGFEA